MEDEAFAEGVDDHYTMHQQRGAYVGIALYGDAMYLAEFETAPFQSVKVQQRYCVFAFNAEVSDDVTAVFRTLNLLRNKWVRCCHPFEALGIDGINHRTARVEQYTFFRTWARAISACISALRPRLSCRASCGR